MRYRASGAQNHGAKGAHRAHSATSRRLGTAAETGDGGPAARRIEPDSTGGVGAGEATICSASRAIPLAESIDSSNPNSICSTASEVGSATPYRHRVTFALLPLSEIEKCTCNSRGIVTHLPL